jgi:hypothetical protein
VLDNVRPRLVRVVGSSWTLGILAALAGWQVALMHPFVGLDASWQAALYMAAERGLGFGTQIVFTYGPLGFLNQRAPCGSICTGCGWRGPVISSGERLMARLGLEPRTDGL